MAGSSARPARTANVTALYDTTLPGNGNGGHLWGTDLPEAEKEYLLAYLKTL